jgi:K+-transporting ATPase ATPase A chain
MVWQAAAYRPELDPVMTYRLHDLGWLLWLGVVSTAMLQAVLIGWLVLLAVFLGGLMVGRTPEFLGKRVRRREATFVALYALTMPAVLLVGTAIAIGSRSGRSSLLNLHSTA